MEFISWVLHLSQNASQLVQSQSASNYLFISYIVVGLIIKDCRFLVAFFICEIWAEFIWVEAYTEQVFYIVNSLVYLHLYWFIQKYKFKTLLFCIIMILFDMGMLVDATKNQGIESFLYSHYINFIVFIHICIICSLLDIERIVRDVRDYAGSVLGYGGYGYNMSFFLLQFNFKTNKKTR